MSLYDVNTKQFVFAYKECVSQYYIHLYLYMVFFFFNFLGPHNSIWSLALFGTKSQGPQKKLTNLYLL